MSDPRAARAVIVPPARSATATEIATRLCGRRLVGVTELPSQPWMLGDEGLVIVIDLASDRPEAAVDATVRGVDVILSSATTPPVRVLDALDRVATVLDWREAPIVELAPSDVVLLHRLGQGSPLPAAAAAAGLSERTAHRRLAAARRRWRATTNANLLTRFGDAVAWWCEHGRLTGDEAAGPAEGG